MDKYIPIPEENFFSNYLSIEALQNIVTIDDLENDKLLIDNSTTDKQEELKIIRELYEEIFTLKNVYVFSDSNYEIDNLLDDIKRREFELNTTNNLEELSETFIYNQQNRFNRRPFIYDVKSNDVVNKNAVIDTRMFDIQNWNLNYYNVIETKFIHNAHIQYYNYNLPYGNFWCKLNTFDKSLVVLDNCKDLYFYYCMHNNTPQLYYRTVNKNKIYFASNNFTYVKHDYDNTSPTLIQVKKYTETLILQVNNNLFTKFNK